MSTVSSSFNFNRGENSYEIEKNVLFFTIISKQEEMRNYYLLIYLN
jgi:hypothetical protein